VDGAYVADTIRRCATLIRFCGVIVSYDGELRSHGRFGGAIMWCGPEVVKGQRLQSRPWCRFVVAPL